MPVLSTIFLPGFLCMTLLSGYALWRRRSLPPTFSWLYILTLAVPVVAATMYGVMFFGARWGMITVENVFFPRIVDWSITTPIIILLIGLLATKGRLLNLHLQLVVLDLVMIWSGLVMEIAFAPESLYAFWLGTVAFLAIVGILLGPMRALAQQQAPPLRDRYLFLSVTMVVLWTMYPVVQYLGSDGLSQIGMAQELGLFTALDVSTKGLFCYLFLNDKAVIQRLSS